MKHHIRKIVAVLLVGALAAGTAGCSAVKDAVQAMEEVQGRTVSWHFSDIEGQITADMTIREQDDFHAAVNKDWLVSNKPDKDGINIDLFRGEKEMEKQQRLLIRDPASTDYLTNTSVGMSAEEIAHAGDLVARFAAEAADTEKRTALGAEPMRPYVEAVLKIGSLSEMSAFIAESEKNIPGSPIIEITVGSTKTDPETYRVLVKPINNGYLTLGDCTNYDWIDDQAIFAKQKKSAITRLVMEKLGYGEAEVNKILKNCYYLECRMAQHMLRQGAINADDFEENYTRELSVEEADALMGDYPFAAYLKNHGLDSAGKVTIYQPDYMAALGETYAEANLEEFKAFYLVNTIYAGCDLLDPATADEVRFILTRGKPEEETEDTAEESDSPDSSAPMDMGTDAELTAEDKADDALINDYIKQYLPAPFDMMYIAAYLSGDEKEALADLTHNVKAELRNILATEEWMTEESRANCVDKLDHMAERILFPDEYISYLPLDFSKDENLVDMVRSILNFNESRRASFVGKKRTRNEWDLMECPTTVANAFNNIAENAIIIPSGITAGGFTFSVDAPYEQNLARMGTILGHEMTHGFDDTGTKYDKFGIDLGVMHRNDLMSAADRNIFTSKTYRLSAWYTAQSPAPGMDSYKAGVSGEAIADMGGMKCALMAAGRVEDFDYDLFFRSYAQLWRKVCTDKVERLYAQQDVHPLAFFRTNVTVQQFDEFMKTYDVKEGDGMYLTPEDRIIIW